MFVPLDQLRAGLNRGTCMEAEDVTVCLLLHYLEFVSQHESV